MTLARDGDLAAFERLVERWKQPVCAITLSVLREVSASEDIAQEVFLTAWQKISQLENPDSFGPWIRQIARNQALACLRSTRRREARVVADTDTVDATGAEDAHEERERRRLVQDALDRLPDDAREVMILFYREGQSVQAVATLLELSEGAVKKRLSRARQAIRDDVLPQLAGALAGSAPGLAFTSVVMASVKPTTAAAATGSGAALSGSPATLSIGAALLVFVGYTAAERITQPHLVPVLRRARLLTVVGFVLQGLGMATGSWVGASLGFFAMLGLVTWVQVMVLPVAFEPPDGRKNWGYRVGMAMGLLGLGVGLFFGIRGWLLGSGLL